MNIESTYRLALQLHQQGLLAQAEVLYQQVLRLQPKHPDALHYLALLCYQSERLTQAKSLYETALTVAPNNIDLMQHFAICLRDLGDFEQAFQLLQQAYQMAPQDCDVIQNLANLYWHQDNYAQACALYQRCRELQPQDSEIQQNLASLLVLWGNQAHQQGDYGQAKQCFERAISLSPPQAELFYNLANAQRELGELTQARQHYQMALKLSPNDADIYNNLANVARELGDLAQALQHYQNAIRLNPQLGHALVHWIHQKQHACDWQQLSPAIQQVRTWVSQQAPMQISPFAFLSMPDTSAAEQLQCANLWLSQRYARCFAQSQQQPYRYHWQHDKIRIGYLSADFRQHPLACLVSEVLECHHRKRFSIYAYSSGKDDGSAQRARFMQAVDHFRDIRSLGIVQAADLIHADEIDILVDLTGFTQNSRAQIAALKPAPISINWLGYPGTMGGYLGGKSTGNGNDVSKRALYNYLIADRVVIPPEQQAHYAEQILYMPHCYQPNDGQRAPARPPCNISASEFAAERVAQGLAPDAMVYACFNQSFKILPSVFAVWCQILQQVPNSQLWLLQCHGLAQQNLLAAAQQHGISADRIVFAPRCEMAAHIQRMALADLFLDTLPYNAHTSASDALWAGLPVLTCIGETFASRVAASLLQTLGLPEMICQDMQQYQQLAIQLGLDAAQRKALQAKLWQLRSSSALFDSQLFCRDLEDLYRQVRQAAQP